MNLLKNYKSIRLKILDEKNNNIKDSVLRLESGDTLIVQFLEEATYEESAQIISHINDSLSNKANVMVIPHNINLKILKKE